jgi:hypothetical protein
MVHAITKAQRASACTRLEDDEPNIAEAEESQLRNGIKNWR